MANRPSVAFACNFQADGTSTTLGFSTETGPVGFYPPFGTTPSAQTPVVSPLFDAVATDVIDMVCSWPATVTVTSFLLGYLTLSFSAAPPAGIQTVQGNLLF